MLGLTLCSEALLAIPAATGLCFNYKRQKDLKQRLQVRRTGHRLQGEAADDPAILSSSFEVMEAVAQACMEAWCESEGFPTEAARSHFGDFSFGESLQLEDDGAGAAGKGKSVLNLYHYFNEETCLEEPCRQHADPGLVTVLCRSSTTGLEVRLPLKPGGAPGIHATYQEEWQDVEEVMDQCAQDAGATGRGVEGSEVFCFLVIVGETLERLSAGRHPACLHRVARPRRTAAQPRFNMAFELRPRCNVWHPWQQVLATGATA